MTPEELKRLARDTYQKVRELRSKLSAASMFRPLDVNLASASSLVEAATSMLVTVDMEVGFFQARDERPIPDGRPALVGEKGSGKKKIVVQKRNPETGELESETPIEEALGHEGENGCR